MNFAENNTQKIEFQQEKVISLNFPKEMNEINTNEQSTWNFDRFNDNENDILINYNLYVNNSEQELIGSNMFQNEIK
jgi:hypothetical protein